MFISKGIGNRTSVGRDLCACAAARDAIVGVGVGSAHAAHEDGVGKLVRQPHERRDVLNVGRQHVQTEVLQRRHS